MVATNTVIEVSSAGGGCLMPQASSALGLLPMFGLMLFGLVMLRRKEE